MTEAPKSERFTTSDRLVIDALTGSMAPTHSEDGARMLAKSLNAGRLSTESLRWIAPTVTP